MNENKPLAGLKILDFSAVYAGPICTRLLADCGADVVKVEPPQGGDLIRGPKGTSRVFVHFNTGKRSIAIDLKNPGGQELARKLALEADVVIENFRPGVMKRFSLDYESIKKIHPKVIYCSISGFGQSGPFVNRAAYAPIAHAASGFDMAHTRSQEDPNGKPANWGIMIADMLTGSYAFGAIQTALLGSQRTGLGEHIDVTMMESMMMLIPGQIQAAQVDNAPSAGGFHPISVKDGFVMICIVSEKNLRELCEAMDRPDMLEDERFSRKLRFRHTAEFIAEIESWSLELTAAECEAKLNQFGVPCSIYNSPQDLFAHPQLLTRQAFTELEDSKGSYWVQNAPFQLAGADISTSTQFPLLGEHTDEILAQVLNLSAEEISDLREQRVVA
jgi:crotonobetainyl-CoA:carnitine CoA-transferase CaiB-like acyl-CoA transferase